MNYSYLTYALQKTDLDDVLNGEGDYTLYAPNNSAFIGFLMRGGYSTLDEVPKEALKTFIESCNGRSNSIPRFQIGVLSNCCQQ